MQDSIPLDCFYIIYAIGQRIANFEFEGTGLGLTIVKEIVENMKVVLLIILKKGKAVLLWSDCLRAKSYLLNLDQDIVYCSISHR